MELKKDRQILSKIYTRMKEMKIPPYWINKRFQDLKGDENYLAMVNKIKEWDFEIPSHVVLLSSENGIGKTHIAVCILRKFIHETYTKQKDITNDECAFYSSNVGFPGYFIKEQDIYHLITESYREDSTNSEKKIINDLVNMPLLIIDDMFASRDNNFSNRIMYEIIDKRIDWYRRPTVITSNYTISDINKINPRIASRLYSPLQFEIRSVKKDYRENNQTK